MKKVKLPNIPKGKWMKAAELIDIYYFFVSIVKCFTEKHPGYGFGTITKHYVGPLSKGLSTMLHLRKEFDQNSQFLADKMINNPDWASDIHRQILTSGQKMFILSRKMRKTNFKKLTEKQILKIYRQIYRLHRFCHLSGAGINWMSDAEKERFSHRILKIIEKKIKKYGLKLDEADTFSILTTPLKKSFVEKEGQEFLQLAEVLRKNKKILSLFTKSNIKQIKESLPKLKKANQLIQKHYLKWRWTNYVYTGPCYDLDYYLERWQALFSAKESPKAFLDQKKYHRQQIIARQKQLTKELKLNDKEKKIIKIAREAVWIKGFRKDVLYHAMYGYEPMLMEIGKRNGLTLKQVRALCQWEIEDILQGKQFDPSELNQRHEHSLMYSTKGKMTIFLGSDADRFLRKMNIEKIKTKGVKEMKGTCAQTGMAKGTVKIVNRKSDNHKVKKGDIMVSHTTSPDLVPAMKKAAAIVTEAGGLTCHAAIVSRELETPCVVGTLVAAKVFKDGDRVEVDATKGIVKKI